MSQHAFWRRAAAPIALAATGLFAACSSSKHSAAKTTAVIPAPTTPQGRQNQTTYEAMQNFGADFPDVCDPVRDQMNKTRELFNETELDVTELARIPYDQISTKWQRGPWTGLFPYDLATEGKSFPNDPPKQISGTVQDVYIGEYNELYLSYASPTWKPGQPFSRVNLMAEVVLDDTGDFVLATDSDVVIPKKGNTFTGLLGTAISSRYPLDPSFNPAMQVLRDPMLMAGFTLVSERRATDDELFANPNQFTASDLVGTQANRLRTADGQPDPRRMGDAVQGLASTITRPALKYAHVFEAPHSPARSCALIGD